MVATLNNKTNNTISRITTTTMRPIRARNKSLKMQATVTQITTMQITMGHPMPQAITTKRLQQSLLITTTQATTIEI